MMWSAGLVCRIKEVKYWLVVLPLSCKYSEYGNPVKLPIITINVYPYEYLSRINLYFRCVKSTTEFLIKRT